MLQLEDETSGASGVRKRKLYRAEPFATKPDIDDSEVTSSEFCKLWEITEVAWFSILQDLIVRAVGISIA